MPQKITKRFNKWFVGNKPFNSRAAAEKEASKDDKPKPKPTIRDKLKKRVPGVKAMDAAVKKVRESKKKKKK